MFLCSSIYAVIVSLADTFHPVACCGYDHRYSYLCYDQWVVTLYHLHVVHVVHVVLSEWMHLCSLDNTLVTRGQITEVHIAQ